MAKRDAKLSLQDIVDSIELIENYMHGMGIEQFSVQTEKQDAVIRRTEIIGEAVKNIPQEIRDLAPKLPWKAPCWTS